MNKVDREGISTKNTTHKLRTLWLGNKNKHINLNQLEDKRQVQKMFMNSINSHLNNNLFTINLQNLSKSNSSVT